MEVTVERVSSFDLRNLLGYGTPQSVIDAHADCCRRSNTIWLGRADGLDACAVGLIGSTIFTSEPYLWLITTKICEQHPFLFIRWSRRVVDEILDLYPSVIGLCRCDNVTGQRWLQWLGARFDGSSAGEYLGFRIARWRDR